MISSRETLKPNDLTIHEISNEKKNKTRRFLFAKYGSQITNKNTKNIVIYF